MKEKDLNIASEKIKSETKRAKNHGETVLISALKQRLDEQKITIDGHVSQLN